MFAGKIGARQARKLLRSMLEVELDGDEIQLLVDRVLVAGDTSDAAKVRLFASGESLGSSVKRVGVGLFGRWLALGVRKRASVAHIQSTAFYMTLLFMRNRNPLPRGR